jgi:hypothetical protein
MDNVKMDGVGGSEADQPHEFRAVTGDFRIGLLVVENAKNRNMWWSNHGGNLRLEAETLVARGGGGEGVLFREGVDASIETLRASQNEDCDLRVDNSNVTIENLEIEDDEVCGQSISREEIDPPAVWIVGEVAGLSSSPGESRPLTRGTVAIMRPEGSGGPGSASHSPPRSTAPFRPPAISASPGFWEGKTPPSGPPWRPIRAPSSPRPSRTSVRSSRPARTE